MNRLTPFGERILSRDADRQTAEIQIRIAITNRLSAFGRAKIEAIAGTTSARDPSCPNAELRNIASRMQGKMFHRKAIHISAVDWHLVW